jgi:hypothetical protein
MFSKNILKISHKFYIFLFDIYINGQKRKISSNEDADETRTLPETHPNPTPQPNPAPHPHPPTTA